MKKPTLKTDKLTNDIIFAASERGVFLSRNNSGVATYGKGKNKFYVAYGVGPKGGGGGDLIGLTSLGTFVSIEIKVGDDVRSDNQIKWHNWVTMRGGFSGVARSVEDAISIMAGGKGSEK